MIKELQKLGLNFYESKALDKLIIEDLTAKELSKKADIPYGKTHSLLLGLKEKDLISSTQKRPQKYFVENVSLMINSLLSKKINEDQQIVDKLQKKATQIDVEKQKQTYFFEIGTDNEDNKELQMKVFNEAQKEVCQILNVIHKPHSNRAKKEMWENAIVDAVNKGVKFREIYPVDSELPLILKKLVEEKPEMFQIRRLDTSMARVDIVDNKIALVKVNYTDPLLFGGVFLIRNRKLANNLQNIFEDLWKKAE